jgi:hypothetical protein
MYLNSVPDSCCYLYQNVYRKGHPRVEATDAELGAAVEHVPVTRSLAFCPGKRAGCGQLSLT